MDVYFHGVSGKLKGLVYPELSRESIKRGTPFFLVMHSFAETPEELFERESDRWKKAQQVVEWKDENLRAEHVHRKRLDLAAGRPLGIRPAEFDPKKAVLEDLASKYVRLDSFPIHACLQSGGGILFLSGERFGGFKSLDAARAFEQRLNNRVHCFRASCPENAPQAIVRKIGTFLEQIKTLKGDQPLPWEIIELKPWPENLLAIYLLLKMYQKCNEKRADLERAFHSASSEIRVSLLTEAWVEFRYGNPGDPERWKKAGLPMIEGPDPGRLPPAAANVQFGSINIDEALQAIESVFPET